MATAPTTPAPDTPDMLELPGGQRLAYHRHAGRGPGVVFLGGFMSDMTGTKALALDARCREQGRAFVRFDYRGHGASSGAFSDGTIGWWTDDALAALDRLTDGPQVLVGSSMGGWIMLLVALARPERVAGLVGVAAAPDFTEDLMWNQWDAAKRARLMGEGRIEEPSAYGEAPYVVTRALIEDGRRHLLLGAAIPLSCPVRLIHGMADPDVPWSTALRLAERLRSTDAVATLVKDGDHRLSRDEDLQRLVQAVESITK